MSVKEKKQVLIYIIETLLKNPAIPLKIFIQKGQRLIETFLYAVEAPGYYNFYEKENSKDIDLMLKHALHVLNDRNGDLNLNINLIVGDEYEIKGIIRFFKKSFTNIKIAA